MLRVLTAVLWSLHVVRPSITVEAEDRNLFRMLFFNQFQCKTHALRKNEHYAHSEIYSLNKHGLK